MNSNKTLSQQLHEQGAIHQYFHSLLKNKEVEQSSQKALSLIEQGRLKIHPETPFPIEPRNKTVAKPARRLPPSYRLQTVKPYSQSPAVHQISNKNRRYIQSLLQKYRVFEAALQQKSRSVENQDFTLQNFERICHYEEMLRNSPQRIPTTQQEKHFLEQQTYNLRLAYSISEDEAKLKEQARRLNCSLHRKNKYYDCLDDIRRKISSLDIAPEEGQSRQSHAKPLLTEACEPAQQSVMKRRQKPLARPEIQKGRAYLNYSRQVGVESKGVYERERGKVTYLREVVHHWWSSHDSQRLPTLAVQSPVA